MINEIFSRSVDYYQTSKNGFAFYVGNHRIKVDFDRFPEMEEHFNYGPIITINFTVDKSYLAQADFSYKNTSIIFSTLKDIIRHYIDNKKPKAIFLQAASLKRAKIFYNLFENFAGTDFDYFGRYKDFIYLYNEDIDFQEFYKFLFSSS